MNRPKLYIHIGTHKTGTTTIQATLSENHKRLAKEGIIYLGQYMTFAKKITRAKDTDKDIEKELIPQICKKLAHKIKIFPTNKNYRFVISNEKFSGDKLTGYKNAGVIAAILNEVTKPLNLDVYIIVFLRRQDDFLESLYTQGIYNGASYTFDRFFDMFDSTAFNWGSLLNSYAEIFGKKKIITRRYGESFHPEANDLIQDFGHIIDSKSLKNYIDTHPLNPGFSRDALEVLRLVNPHLSKKDRGQMKRILKSVSAKQHYEKYSFFEPQQRVDFLFRYESSNARVAEEYFNESSGKLFPLPHRDDQHEYYMGLTPESVATTMTKAIVITNNKIRALKEEIKQSSPKESVQKKFRRKASTLLSATPWLKARLRNWIGK